MTIDAELVIGLYERYAADLRRVRETMRKLFDSRCVAWRNRSLAHKVLARAVQPFMGPVGLTPRMMAQGDDETVEILYLLLRHSRPSCVVEISPFHGWSTNWILTALRDNGSGTLRSFDLIDASRRNVPESLAAGRWELVVGDVTKRAAQLPEPIDFLLMDSDHSASFADWYIDNVFPRVVSGSFVCVDDVYHTADPGGFDGEGERIVRWLESRRVPFFTCAKKKNPSALNAITGKKVALGLARRLLRSDTNPAIYFCMPELVAERKAATVPEVRVGDT